jgi:surface antigen
MPAPIADPSTQAFFVSKSVATRQVVQDSAAFTQVILLKNIGTQPWTGCKLVHVPVYGAAKKATDLLGAVSGSVPVPATSPGGTAAITLSLKAVKSNPKSGAAQAAPWELQLLDGTKIPVVTAPGVPAKGGAVWTVVSINPPAGPGIPNLAHPAYTDRTKNRYVDIGNGGQCTSFVYARIQEKLGIDLTKVPGAAFGCNGAGQKWIDQLTGPGKPYTLSPAPRENSIAVWCLTADPNQGHVAFIESVTPAGIAGYNEANAISYASFAADNGPDSDTWGGGYDGKLRTDALPALQAHLGARYTLKGFIGL